MIKRFEDLKIGRFEKLIINLIILNLLILESATVFGAGTTTAEFLKIGVNARAVAMGGALTSISDDVNSIYWNPGGLAQQKNMELAFTHNIWLQNVTYDYIAFIYPLGEGAIASSISYLSTGKIQGYDLYGIKTNEFTNYDIVGSIAYSHKLTEPITGNPIFVGLSLKNIYQKLDDDSSLAVAADIGGIYKLEDLSIGVVLQNLGTTMKFVNESFQLPMNIKVGAGYRLLNDSLTLAIDVNFPRGSNTNIATGGEYKYQFGDYVLAGRIGYNTGASKELGNLAGISAGIGFGFKGIGLDYAWIPFGDLGQAHQISLSYKF